jgi:hypothetical protein
MRTSEKMKTPIIICMLLLSLFGAFAIHYSTHWGPVVYGDSTGYITSARNLLAGHGLGVFTPSGRFRPLGYFPPFYPLALSALGFMGMDLIAAARLLSVALFSMTILLIGLSFYTLSRSPWLSLSLTLLILTSPELLSTYLSAMSESLFFFTGFAGIFLLMLYLEKTHRQNLIAAAIAAGLAYLTRNIGITFIIAGALCLIIFQRRPLRRRIKDGAYYLALSSIPMIIWRIWLSIQPYMVSTHRFQYTAGNIWTRLSPVKLTFVNVFWGWLPHNELFPSLSYRFKLMCIFLIALFFGVLYVLTIKRIRKQGAQDWLTHRGVRLTSLLMLFIATYIITLVISYLYVHPTVPIGDRHFSPILLAVLIAVFSLSYLIIQAWPCHPWLQILPVAAMLITVTAWLPSSHKMALEHYRDGAGFTGVRWRNSGTIDDLKELSPDIPIITNEPAAVLFLTDRTAYEIDELYRTASLTDFTNYGGEMDDPVQQLFREDGAALVLFDSLYWQLYPIYDEETPQRLEEFTQGLRLYSDSWDGAIYFYDAAEY